MAKAFPEAPIYTSLFNPDTTFPEFGMADIRTTRLDRIGILRRRHRLALPLLAPIFSTLRVQADVVLCSSSGWAHGLKAIGKKIVYCHTPARWLYQPDRYLSSGEYSARGALAALRLPLTNWDQRAARTAERYVTQCTAVRDRIRAIYGLDAEVLPAPWTIKPDQPRKAIVGLEPGFFLCVSRLLPYKNVDRILAAFSALPGYFLAVVGTGPEAQHLARVAPSNTCLMNQVSDSELAWLYGNCRAVVSASYEDYGLTPLEGAAFGKPAAVLRWGGFLDTVIEGETGLFFDRPDPEQIAGVVSILANDGFSTEKIRTHALKYSEEKFISRLREIVHAEAVAT